MENARERRRASTVEAVTREALALFEQQGYDTTLVSDVAGSAGVSRRTIFRHFAGKDDLLRGIHDRWLRVFADHLVLDADGASVRDIIAPAIAAVADSVLADPGRVLRAHRLIEEVPALRAAWLRYEHEWRDALAEIIDREHGPGVHASTVMAAAIAANLTGALALWSRRPDRVELHELLASGFDVVIDHDYRPRPSSIDEPAVDGNGLNDVGGRPSDE